MTSTNTKGELIARLVSLGLGVPTFDAQASGPAHERQFRVTVTAGGQVLGSGEARTKKEAERLASEQALLHLGGSGDVSGAGATAASPTGPWPIYAQVLAQAVEAALELADEDATLQDIRQDAAQFYRDLLGDLGHGPENA